MRNAMVLVLLFSVVFSAQAQESEVRPIGSFKGIKAAAGVDVYLKKGARESIRVEASGIPLKAIITEVSGTWLKVHVDHGDWHSKKSMKVYVTYVQIERLSASSAANIFSDGPIKSEQIEIAAYSAASVEATIEAGSVTVETGSAGDVVLEGKVTSLSVDASSAGKLDAYKLDAENVTVSTASAGEAKVSVTKALVANANSGGSVFYRGNPSKTMSNATSGGSVKKSN